MSEEIKTADDLLDRFKRETGYWPPARSAPMEMGDPYSGCEKERIVNDLFHTWRSRVRLEAEVAELKTYKTALVESRPHHEKLLDDLVTAEAKVSALTDEVAELKRERDLYRQAFGYVTIGDVTLEIGDDWDVDGGTVLVNDKPVEWSKDLDIAKAVVAARDGDEKSGLLEE